MENLPIRTIKNVIVSIGIVICLALLYITYQNAINDLYEQEESRSKTKVTEVMGKLSEKNQDDLVGTSNYSKGETKKVKEDSENIEDVTKTKEEYIKVKVNKEKCGKFIGVLLITIILILYIIISKGQKIGPIQMCKSVLTLSIFCMTVVLLMTVGSYGFITNINAKASSINKKQKKIYQEESGVNIDGVYVLDDTKKKFEGTYKSIKSEQNIFVAKNDAILTLESSIIDKGGINSYDYDNVNMYGTNSAILATNEGRAILKDVNIYSSADGASGIFATGENSRIEAQNMIINSVGNKLSHGIVATQKGKAIVKDFKMVTNGKECAALKAGEQGGIIESAAGEIVTCGESAPIVYTNKLGNVVLNDINGEAKESNPIIMDGPSTIELTNSQMYGNVKGYVKGHDEAAVLIRSESCDYTDRQPSTIKITNSVLGIEDESEYYRTAPTFVVANAIADIQLTNTRIDQGSKILFDIKAIKDLGVKQKSGGIATVTATGQKMVGFAKVDETSEFSLKLTKGSIMVGGINYLNSGSKKVELELDSTSKFILTTNVYLTKFKNQDTLNRNITFGRFKIFVNGKPIN